MYTLLLSQGFAKVQEVVPALLLLPKESSSLLLAAQELQPSQEVVSEGCWPGSVSRSHGPFHFVIEMGSCGIGCPSEGK